MSHQNKTALPPWVKDLISSVAGIATPLDAGHDAPPGFHGRVRCGPTDGHYEVEVFPLTVAVVGGLHDGARPRQNHNYDISQVVRLFVTTTGMHFGKCPDRDGYFVVTGRLRDSRVSGMVRLILQLEAPADRPPDYRINARGELIG